MVALKPDSIRNIALVGHGGAGKTSLGEAVLHVTGATNRLGSVPEGTSVLDFTEEEQARKHSLETAVCSVTHRDTHINIIDTPGAADFCGQAIPALAAAETVILVVSATAGIEVNTRRMYERATEYGLGVFMVINKIDADNINLPELVSQLQESFGAQCLPINLPASGGTAVVSCFGNGPGSPDFGELESAKTAVIEAIVGINDELMEKYLGGEVSNEEALEVAAEAVCKGELIPIVFTGARNEIGIMEFLDGVVAFCPNVLQGKRRSIVDNGDSTEIDPADTSNVIGQVFKIAADHKSNIKFSYVRLHSGSIRSDTNLHLSDDRKGLRAGQVFRMKGGEHEEMEEGTPGDVIGLAKLDLRVGDTIFSGTGGKIELPKLPTPMFALAIEPKTRGDEDKISAALRRYTDEDPCFIVERNTATRETVIRGIGDVHLRTILQRVTAQYKVELETKPPKIPYRETVTVAARDVEYTHKKQTGGAGQFARVIINVEPLERGAGYEFVDKIFGGAIDQSFRPSVDKGIKQQMIEGVLAGYPVVDVRVELVDGKTHPVDSKDIAFQIAGRGAFKDAFLKAKPILLEPIVNIEVTTPVDCLGDIQGDLASRRGQPQGQDVLPGNMAVLKATAPLSEVADYHSRLSSITGGRGSYVMELSRYEPVPGNVQQKLVAEHRKGAAKAD